MSRLPARFVRPFCAPRPTATRRQRPRLTVQNLEDRAVPAIFTVTTTLDSGAGSLREAITLANGAAGADEIRFASGAGEAFENPAIINLAGNLGISGSSLTITGTGANRLTVRRDPAAGSNFGIFSIASSAPTVQFDGLTISGGTSGNGAGITGSTASLTVSNSVITGNTGGTGGAIYIPPGQTGLLTVRNSTISGNSGGTGGIYFWGDGNLLVQNSTISGNIGTGTAGFHGGGIIFYGAVGSSGVTIENSTITGNTSASSSGGGGGINFRSASGSATIRNSTITGNTGPTGAAGGGGVGVTGGSLTLTVASTIIAENTGPADGPDLRLDSGTAEVSNSLIGVIPPANYNGTATQTGTQGSPLDPQLGVLQDNGGPTFTRKPLAGSRVLDVGSNPGSLFSDQRGFGFVRQFNGTPDVGAFEEQPFGLPVASASTTNVTAAGLTPNTFTVTYADPNGVNRGIKLPSVDGNSLAVRVVGPSWDVPATFVSVDNTNPASTAPRTATYTFAIPGGAWDAADNGIYSVVVQANQVFDFDDQPVPTGPVGSFQVQILNFIVSTDDDSGFGSLRQVLTDAAIDPGPNTITFDPTFAASAQTVSLLSPLPVIANGDLNLVWPGDGTRLTVERDTSAATDFGILEVDVTAPSVTLENLIITGGTAGRGSAITGSTESLTVRNSEVRGNIGGIGAIYIPAFQTGILTVQNSTISGNSGGTGGIYFYYGGNLRVQDSAFFDNTGYGTQGWHGGGLVFFGGVGSNGGVTIENSTFHNNTTASSAGGGGINFGAFSGTATVRNSTITGNTAPDTGGGGIGGYGSGTINISSTIIAGNVGPTTESPDVKFLAGGSINAVASKSFVGVEPTSGWTGTGILTGDPLLGPLQDNGGGTFTRAPDTGSPVLDAGENLSPIATFDQRGFGYLRSFGAGPDIGAFEEQPLGVPFGIADVTNVTASGATTYTFTVTYYDVTGTDRGIDVSTLINNNGAVQVSDGLTFNVFATYVSIDNLTNGSPRTVTYSFTPPNGAWDSADGGTYTISVVADEVFDIGTPATAVPAGVIASFLVDIPPLIVTNANDSGPGSLREALSIANTFTFDDEIIFDPAVFNTPQTITLASPLPMISATAGNLAINGPGANFLTLDGGDAFRVLDSAAPVLNLSGFTVRGGLVTDQIGAGLRASGFVTLDRMEFRNNMSAGTGVFGFDIASGGAIGMAPDSFLQVTNSTIADNVAGNSGGGIFMRFSGSLLVESSTISGNSTNFTGTYEGFIGGAGIFIGGYASYAPPPGFEPGAFVIRNSTIANNATTGSGGGVFGNSFTGNLLIQSSTISGNSAAKEGNMTFYYTYEYGGGGIGFVFGNPTITLENSVVAVNTNGAGNEKPDIQSVFPVNVNSSVVGSEAGFTITTGANLLAPGTDLKLGTLQDNGGPTETMAPAFDSPLLDIGDNSLIPFGVTTDQRGVGLDRIYPTQVDIGSIEFQPPRVTVEQALTQADPVNAGPIVFTVRFTMPVTDFDDTSDIVITSSPALGTLTATITPVAGSESEYTVSVTGMSGEGTVMVSVPANVAINTPTGLMNSASTSVDNVVTFDNVGPTVTIARSVGQADPTKVPPVRFDVTFSEPDVTFDASDVSFAGSTVGGTLVAGVTQTGPTTFLVTVTGMTGTGVVAISVPAGTVFDDAGNGNTASTGANTVTFDEVAPTVTVNKSPTQPDPTSSPSVVFDIVFSEPVIDFVVGDIDLSASTVGGILTPSLTQINATTYQLTVSGITSRGKVVASIPAGIATDPAGNPNAASTHSDNEIEFLKAGVFNWSQSVFTTTEGSFLSVTATRTGGTEGNVSVSFNTSNGTAISTAAGANPADYAAATDTLTWLEGEGGPKTFLTTIAIANDTLNEGRETITLTLTNPVGGATIGTATAQATIAQSDGKNESKAQGTFFDTDGDKVTIKVARPRGEASTLLYYLTDPDGDGKGPIEIIDLTGSTAKTGVTITVTKPRGVVGNDGKVGLGELNGQSLKNLTAKGAHLDGAGITLTGTLGAVSVANIKNGADIIATGALPVGSKMKSMLTAAVIEDGTTIDLKSPINRLTAIAIGDGLITAPGVGTIMVKGKPAVKKAGVIITPAIPGDFKSDLFITDTADAKKKGLTNLTVKGSVIGSTITVKGNVGTITAGMFENSKLFAGYVGPDNGVGGAFNFPSTVTTFRVTGKPNVAPPAGTPAFTSSYLVATVFKNVTLASAKTANGGVPFGIAADTSAKVTLTSLKKTVTQSTVGITTIDGDLKVAVV